MKKNNDQLNGQSSNSDELKNQKNILDNAKLRTFSASENFERFFHTYFYNHIKYDTAPFQREMMQILDDDNKDKVGIVAFRGSAKSTIVTLAYSIYSILGRPQKKHILIICGTQDQVGHHQNSIKFELENNEILKRDFGPFKIDESIEGRWNAKTIELPKYGAVINIASMHKSIRGLKYNSHRPDLIIADDIEDLEAVRTKESRDNNYRWLKSEAVSGGSEKTKFISIGNLLHFDSVMMRLKDEFQNDEKAVFKEYPLVDNQGICLWTSRFPDKDAIKNYERKIGSEEIIQRELYLKIVPEEEQIVRMGDIKYYDVINLSDILRNSSHCLLSLDVACGKDAKSDYTAIVPACRINTEKGPELYILPYIVNEKIGIHDTKQAVKRTIEVIANQINYMPRLLVEVGGYQTALIAEFRRMHIVTDEFKTLGDNKRERLMLAVQHFKTESIFFPNKGAEDLIKQLIDFPFAKNDDLVDAFSMSIITLMEKRGNALKLAVTKRHYSDDGTEATVSVDSDGKVEVLSLTTPRDKEERAMRIKIDMVKRADRIYNQQMAIERAVQEAKKKRMGGS